MRTAMHRAEHGCCTHAAYADDDNVVTGSNLSRSRRRSESRCNTAADERRDLKRHGRVIFTSEVWCTTRYGAKVPSNAYG